MSRIPFALSILSLLPLVNPALALEDGDHGVSTTLGYYAASGSFFDAGYGFDFTYSFWRSPKKALAITAGIQTWNLNKKLISERSGNTAIGTGLGGSATLFPVGVSMIWRNPKEGSERLDLGLQLGVQYVFATSDADQLTQAQSPGGAPSTGKNGVHIGSNLIGKIAIEVDYLLNEQTDLIFDCGYQMDFLKGDANAGGSKIDVVELRGFFLRTGLGYRF
jgi:hypothetical protein